MVRPDQTVMLMSSSGQVIRMPAEQISLIGRATQGVTVMKPKRNEVVVTVTISDPAIDRAEENGSLNGKAIS